MKYERGPKLHLPKENGIGAQCSPLIKTILQKDWPEQKGPIDWSIVCQKCKKLDDNYFRIFEREEYKRLFGSYPEEFCAKM
jgi:hypothetical protein